MTERVTNIQVQDFLKDFEKNSETVILEEGKEKNEILAIAKTKGINLKDNRGLAGFKTIYTFADIANKNKTRLPKKTLLKALPSLIGKPVDIDHQRRYVVGHYIDYRYKQKEDMVIAYGVFYKANFGEEWEEAKKLFKSGKLSTSYEIWCPKDKKRILPDGTYELLEQEIAGGALLFKEEPAFEDAKVLEMAKKNSEAFEEDLVFAKKYKDDEIITTDTTANSIAFDGSSDFVEIANDIPLVSPQSTKIKCSNCGNEQEIGQLTEMKCKNCFAVLDRNGNMIYPPQIIDFQVLCPACKVKNWLIVSKTEDTAKIKCLHCSKEYEIIFDKQQTNPLVEKIEFVYEGSVPCYQCNYPIYFSGISSIKSKELRCKKCGLHFSYDISKELHKRISKIIEIGTVKKSSEEGGNSMAENKVEKASETQEYNFFEKSEQENKDEISKRLKENKVEEAKKEEVKVEDKKEDLKAEEQPEAKVQAQEAPQAEVNTDKKYKKILFEYEIIDNDNLEVSQEQFNCSCVECGYKMTSDTHCSQLKCPKCGGQMRRAERPGNGKPTEKAERMTYQQKKALPDNMFAVVVNIKGKRGTRKVRMFPINDEAHVRNALARLGQPAPQATLRKLGVSVESVKNKILRRARALKMTQLLERYKAGVKKLAKRYKELKKANEQEIAFYKKNAVEIIKRREELGNFGDILSDEDILVDEKFVQAKTDKENAEISKSAINKVGEKKKGDDYYKKIKREIDQEAFGQ